MKCKVAELVSLVNYCECMIRGALSLVKVPPFLFIIRSKFPNVIFLSLGKGTTDSDDIPIVIEISRDSIEFVIDRCQGISDSSIILCFSE